MRSLSVLLAVALLSVIVGACAGAGKSTGPAPSVSSAPAATGNAAGATNTPPSAGRPTRRYPNDGDNDPPGDNDADNNSSDNDKDAFLDRPDENSYYHDSDDVAALAFGHPASPADRQAITAVVKRYYAAAAAGDARKACSLLPPSFVKGAALVYGRGSEGESYMHGAKNCQDLLSRVFKHRHRQLSAPVFVTEVRVKGDNAFALLGSKKMRASFIDPVRLHGVWTIDELIGAPLQ